MSARHQAEGLKCAFAETARAAETFDLPTSEPRQRNPQHYEDRAHADSAIRPLTRSLGEPLTIHEVAELLGCSVWTVRQRYMPQGLPCLRASATGKLVFFHQQVIDWILRRQQQKKGGNSR